MVYRITGGLFLFIYGIETLGVVSLSPEINGILALIAGIALLAGF